MAKYLTVVLGAGASKDCVAAGDAVSQYDENWRPPLTAELFASRTNFNSILSKYPKVSAVSEIIRTRLGAENLEDILEDLESSQSLQVKKQVWEVAFYLQELLWTVSDRFITSGGTKFDTLISNLLTANFDRILFLTLNYDLLLDKALGGFDDHAFGSMQDYIPRHRRWLLIKAHGSVNWGHPLLNGSFAGTNADATLASLVDSPELSSETVIIHGDRGLLGFSDQNRAREGRLLFPALAIPTRGEKSFACPNEHIQEVKRFVEKCATFLFIGFSGLDPHLLELFRGVRTVQKIMVVNLNRDEGEKLFRRLLEQNDSLLPVGGYEGVNPYVFEKGFRIFMESGGLSQFLKD